MKFLCLDCDQPMKLLKTDGPDEGSLTVTFRCPECGFRVAMLTNTFETQMVKSLGVKIGAEPTATAAPFEYLRSSLAGTRPDAFEHEPSSAAATGEGGGCPFAGMLAGQSAPEPAPAGLTWTAEAEERLERIPSFIRPMARRAIERLAESKGYATITGAVMDEARGSFGM